MPASPGSHGPLLDQHALAAAGAGEDADPVAAIGEQRLGLTKRGLVERHRESSDRRLVTVRLTAEGETRLAAAYGKENAVERAFFAPLGESELDTFVVLLRRLLRQRTD